MNQYSYRTGCSPEEEYIYDLTNDDLKSHLAIKNTVKADEYNCDLVYGYGGDISKEEYYEDDGYVCFGPTDFYKYNDVLENKKLLFGKDELLTKKHLILQMVI